MVGIRVLTDDDRRSYFVRRGMPTSVDRMRGRYADPYDKNDAFLTAPDLADYREWADARGRTTLV